VNIVLSDRLRSLTGYAFAEVDREVQKLKDKGIEPLDFGVGDPTVATPAVLRQATQRGVDSRASSGYPSYIGAAEFRQAAAAYMKRQLGVQMDPAREICSTVGSKEAVFHLPLGFVNPGDLVICPTPRYPPYSRGTLFSGGTPYYVPITAANKFLPDLDAIPAEVTKRAKILWINYPNSPSGVNAPDEFFKKVIEWGQKHNILIASDEAYIDLYYGQRSRSILEFGRDGVIAVFSLSKRSAMTCYRVGWVAGDSRVVDAFKKIKTNIDSGTATFIQDGAIASLQDESHVDVMRQEYRRKRDILVSGLKASGLPDCTPEATIYVWQRVPKGMTSVEFATRLLHPELAIVTTPGAWISEKTPDGQNAGEGYVRFALVPSVEKTQLAADRIAHAKW
jgi:LL-diaminopimelate aminotransferase